MLAGMPIVIKGGSLGKISIKIPWSKLWTGHCEVFVDDISISATLVDPVGVYSGYDIGMYELLQALAIKTSLRNCEVNILGHNC